MPLFLATSKSDSADHDRVFLHFLWILTVFKHVEVGSPPKEPDFDLFARVGRREPDFDLFARVGRRGPPERGPPSMLPKK